MTVHIGTFTQLGVLVYAAIIRRSGRHLQMATDARGNTKEKHIQFKKNCKEIFDEFKEN